MLYDVSVIDMCDLVSHIEETPGVVPKRFAQLLDYQGQVVASGLLGASHLEVGDEAVAQIFPGVDGAWN